MKQLKINQSITHRSPVIDNYLRDISRKPMVSPQEEDELADKIRNGNEEAYKRLVEANLRFVVSVAKQYARNGTDLCDLINEGNLGLMKAAQRFDPTRGFKFISYAVWWIRQQILQYLNDEGRTVRLPLNQVNTIGKILKEKEKFFQSNEREPSDEELADILDMESDKLRETLSNTGRCLSFDTPVGEDEDCALVDITPDRKNFLADDSLNAESLSYELAHVLSLLGEREREIVRLSFGIGCQEMTMEEIGDRLDLTRERVRQLRAKAIKKMKSPGIKKRLEVFI